jgi:perosamine synthetase
MKKPNIPLSVPTLQGNEWTYIRECLDTNWVSYVGPFVDRFQGELAAACGARYANATVSGTAALHIALILAGVEPDTEVIMPALTFVAPANAVRYCHAWPVFVDVSASDWQLDIDKLATFLRAECEWTKGMLRNRLTQRRIAAVMPVHLLGDLCDVDAVAEIAAEFNLPVVEDAAECVGATYKGRGIGAPVAGIEPSRRQVATSFNGNKIITTGGGGALFTDDEELARRARHLATTAKTDPVAFFHDEVGYNYRLTNVLAALGVAQLERLNIHVARKRAIAARYARALHARPGVAAVHPRAPHTEPIYWLYTVLLDCPATDAVRLLNAAGIQARPLWTPMADLPAFRSCQSFAVDAAPRLHDSAVSLPSSVSITNEEQDYVIEQVLRIARSVDRLERISS